MKDIPQQRKAFLQNLIERLSPDDRFAAAWLTGSYARQEVDALSDIDLTLVVSDEHCQTLCARPWWVSAQTTQEREALFRLFGQPAILHENNHNAPEGGTFTHVTYAPSGLMVDWILRPLSLARRPANAILLWDKAGIPIQPSPEPESQEQRAREASERVAFFWMMAAVTVKYIRRGDGVFANTWLEELAKMVRETERLVKGQAPQHKRGSFTVLKAAPEDQIKAVRRACEQIEKWMPEVKAMGGFVRDSPMPVIERLIGTAQEKLAGESANRPIPSRGK
jgi:hypothetical protein